MKMTRWLVFLVCVSTALAQQKAPEALFNRWDRNGDGKLVLAELPPNAKTNFRRVDINGDGAISLVEHKAFLSRRPAQRSLEGIKVLRDLAYANTDNPRQKLDLVLPEKRAKKEPLPLVVWIHGGGWRNGDKRSGINRVAPLVVSGRYVGATIGYRLSGEVQWPAQIHDCKAAIRWLRAHAKEYDIDPKRIAVWGSSAGGHLVSMLGTSGDVDMLEGRLGRHLEQSSRVQVVVNYYGPSALLLMNSKPSRIDHDAKDSPESQLIGAPIQQSKAKARQASPMTHVTRDDAPHLHVHGTDDPLVPFHQSEIYHAALKKVGVETTLITVRGGGHSAPRTLGRQVQAFLNRHLHGQGQRLPDEVVPAK
ncbi:MAG: carboxylesterase [Verrucomicrobiales bacterium]|nr:carboxylesterase [Verrucomicrobiales bacterium]|tara:strand:+ start:2054 stop:3145 length:1092 start_codon:yes stop_codon:yes gene_type:complete